MINFKVITRNLLRHKLFTGLNIIGLSIGLICVMVIALWIYNETNYDKFNENYDRIFQINFHSREGEFEMTGSPAPLAPVVEKNIAAVEYAARLRRMPAIAFKYGENMFYEENGLTADPQIFDIFSFKTIAGDPKRALNLLEGIVLTQSFAQRYFGSDNPIGKEIQIEGREYCTIMAVIEDVPSQSHIQFDFILSQKLVEAIPLCGLEWGDPNFRTYVLLSPQALSANTAEAITKEASDKGMPHVKWGGMKVSLRPLNNIYLNYAIENRLGETGDYRYLYIFGSVALLILILACINFINITISLYTKRLKSTSIKKILGGKRTSIFLNNFAENGLVVFVAFIFALVSLFYLKPLIQHMLQKQFGELLYSGIFAGILGIVFIITVFLCALYPSLVSSDARAIELMKRFSKKKSGVLKGMVVFQNAIAVLLIIVALGINKQLHFIQNKKLGFNADQIAYFHLRGNISGKIDVVKHALLENPNISEIGLKDCVPYDNSNQTTGVSWKLNGEWQNTNNANPVGMETTRIDDQFFDMMGVQLIAGRNFSYDRASDSSNYIVNEEAVRNMGLDNPVGTEFSLYGRQGVIVGVIRDTYFKTLHEKIRSQLFHLYNDEASESYFSALFFKITGDTKKALAHAEDIWIRNNPGIPFEYHFLDQDYENLYEADTRIAKMMNLFTLLAVFIACMGLFGQALIAADNKIKEIGIRKVNGARVTEIIVMLNKDFIRWVVIAFVLACPIAWYAMHQWLQNFAYKTTLSWWVFVAAGAVAVAVALLTVSWQSWRAATRNPVEALRYE
ncbi:MAG: ABC transporter permease [Bacteroidales bacterium]